MMFTRLKNLLNRFVIKNNYKALPRDRCNLFQRLSLAVDWLKVAHETTGFQGVSAGYSLLDKKWEKAYRETTGYIIPSFIACGQRLEKKELIDQALEMGLWEMRIQNKNGSFGEEKQGGQVSEKVFNTGQVIIGLMTLFHFTGDDKYLESAKKAADWLLKKQDKNGFWIEDDEKLPKTYQSRVSWALLVVFKETCRGKYYEAATKNIEWVLSQQKDNGWFSNTGLNSKTGPWTHLLGYTLSGLWESGQLMDNLELRKRIFLSVELSFKNLFPKIKNNGFLAGEFNENWRGDSSYSCLVGNLQLAIVSLKFYRKMNNPEYLKKAKQLIDYVSEKQVTGGGRDISGSFSGSWPVNGGYAPYFLPNWTAKFFIDAALFELDSELEFLS